MLLQLDCLTFDLYFLYRSQPSPRKGRDCVSRSYVRNERSLADSLFRKAGRPHCPTLSYFFNPNPLGWTVHSQMIRFLFHCIWRSDFLLDQQQTWHCSKWHDSSSTPHWLISKLKADRPLQRDYPHLPTDYRHTDKPLRLVMILIAPCCIRQSP